MSSRIQLLSIDFDGTLVSHVGEPALNRQCVELIRELQDVGAIWAINTGRSVDLLESGITNPEVQIRPDFILTTERDVFRRGGKGTNGSRLANGINAAQANKASYFF